MKKLGLALAYLWVLIPIPITQEVQQPMHNRFGYDASAQLEVVEIGVTERKGTKIHDLTFVSPKGGKVPAYLVVPPGKGPFAAILFGHWAMPESPMRNRSEFLDEAVALARAGAVSLLIDAPFARSGVTEDPDPLSQHNADLMLQQVVDLRRGVDLLVRRSEVDPKRVAYVGHSYNAATGAVLAGVEKRLKAFVLMAGALSYAEILRSNELAVVQWRQAMGEKRLEAYLATYGWLDPGSYLGHAAPSALLLQFARNDGILSEALERRFFDLASAPKELKFYDAGHALNAEARRDRFDWLRSQIGLGPIDGSVLDSVQEIK
jgi:dienelactone hydrolase